MNAEQQLKAVFVSIGIALVPALIGIGLGLAFSDDRPYCDVTIVADGTWSKNSDNGECVMPEWGVFHDDGTWESIDPQV